MRPFVRAVDRLSDALAVVAAVLLIAASIVITWSVVYRALGNSTFWEIEFSVYMMVASLFLASPYTLKTSGHVGVALLSHYLPQRWRTRLAIVGDRRPAGLPVPGRARRRTHLGIDAARRRRAWAPYKWPLFR